LYEKQIQVVERKASLTEQSLSDNTSLSILPGEGEAIFYPAFFSKETSDFYFTELIRGIQWKQEPIKIFGREVMQPRLTAWYGDNDKPYTYSGITMYPHAWTPILREIRQKIEPVAGATFTSALLNRYRNGQDSMGWHRDNEKELGKNPVIGSVSFGEARVFQFRNYKNKTVKKSIWLTHGSLLLMRGETNHCWEHQLPKTNEPLAERINITFRIIK
jgi:alkylated DNA repair dioxygenase AlkB